MNKKRRNKSIKITIPRSEQEEKQREVHIKKPTIVNANKRQSTDKRENLNNDNALALNQLKLIKENTPKRKVKKVDKNYFFAETKLDDYKEDEEEEKTLRLKEQRALEIALKTKSSANDNNENED
jgi:hypothetical protein